MKVKIAKTNYAGRGVFAVKNIKKGESLFMFQGLQVNDKEYARRLKCTLQIGPNVWIDPTKAKDPFGRYINHSCSPNAGIKGKQKIVAMNDIQKGEEVTLDYSITDDDVLWKMNCGCQSQKCRKIIKSIQFLPKELYKKYDLFIPQFLQKFYKLASN